jgi:hypothetical protein
MLSSYFLQLAIFMNLSGHCRYETIALGMMAKQQYDYLVS